MANIKSNDFWAKITIALMCLMLTAKLLALVAAFAEINIKENIPLDLGVVIFFLAWAAFSFWFASACRRLQPKVGKLRSDILYNSERNACKITDLYEKVNELLTKNKIEGVSLKMTHAYLNLILFSVCAVLHLTSSELFGTTVVCDALCLFLGLISIKIIKNYSKVEEKLKGLKDLDVLYREHREKFLAQNSPIANMSAMPTPNTRIQRQ